MQEEPDEDFLECWNCHADEVRMKIFPCTDTKPVYYGQCARCGTESMTDYSREGAVRHWNTTVRYLRRLVALLESPPGITGEQGP